MSMEKTEFLDQLRVSLNGKIDPQEVNENLRYYEDYINIQIRMGKTETEVMELLGSPRLIARSITDAKGVEASMRNRAVSRKEAAFPASVFRVISFRFWPDFWLSRNGFAPLLESWYSFSSSGLSLLC